jgi:hypothetical protein
MKSTPPNIIENQGGRTIESVRGVLWISTQATPKNRMARIITTIGDTRDVPCL